MVLGIVAGPFHLLVPRRNDRGAVLAVKGSLQTPGVVTCRGTSTSCRARQGTRAGEHLHNEVVRAHKWRTVPRGRDFACTNAPQRSALLCRSAHTFPLQL